MFWREVPVRAWFATLALACVGLVAAGLQLQLQLSLAPCPLCIFQRVLYLAIALVALCGAFWPGGRLAWCGLLALLALFGTGVAAYQSWMQAYPHLAPACSLTDPNAIERLVDWLGMRWPSLFLATGFCTSRDWIFLGLSMANWSAIVFAGILAYTLFLATKRD